MEKCEEIGALDTCEELRSPNTCEELGAPLLPESRKGSLIHHLVVLQHGLGGHASDWLLFKETLEKPTHRYASAWVPDKTSCSREDENIRVMFWAPTYNSGDGIAVVGNLLADGIMKKRVELQDLEMPIKYLSAIGHSMGGLFLRYALKLLSEKGILSDPACVDEHRESDAIELCSFVTIATPHLSVWRPDGSWSMGGFVNSIFNFSTKSMSNQSIKEVSLNDAEFHRGAASENQPLLYRMATEKAFTKPLGLFKRGILYANVSGDLQIPYESGTIQKINPYAAGGMAFAGRIEEYPHIVNRREEDVPTIRPLESDPPFPSLGRAQSAPPAGAQDESHRSHEPGPHMESRHCFGVSLRLHFCHACKKPIRNRGCPRCELRFCESCFTTAHKLCETRLFSSGKEPYWLVGDNTRGIEDMYNGLRSIKFGRRGWEHCDVAISGMRTHFSHWLILGIPKGGRHVTDAAMHMMQNLISNDDRIKSSLHPFEVVLDRES